VAGCSLGRSIGRPFHCDFSNALRQAGRSEAEINSRRGDALVIANRSRPVRASSKTSPRKFLKARANVVGKPPRRRPLGRRRVHLLDISQGRIRGQPTYLRAARQADHSTYRPENRALAIRRCRLSPALGPLDLENHTRIERAKLRANSVRRSPSTSLTRYRWRLLHLP
jgi:hypothetical protein